MRQRKNHKNPVNIVIATVHPWNITRARRLKSSRGRVIIITDPQKLTVQWVDRIEPRYIFFPHWSWKIPPQIHDRYECVVFHMTDLPFGRGGSPLQNLIVRGFKKTKISAIRMTDRMDAGPVYLKRSLNLAGPAHEIFEKASDIIFFQMIPSILKENVATTPQKGRPVLFYRRKPQQSDIARLVDVKKVYDHIRMLDAPGYPRAFLRKGKLLLEFSEAALKNNKVAAKVLIRVNP